MANNIQILFSENVSIFSFWNIAISSQSDTFSYEKTLLKAFIPGTLLTDYYLPVGPTMDASIDNLLLSLNTYDLDGNIIFTRIPNGILISFTTIAVYNFEVLRPLKDTIISSVPVVVPGSVMFTPFEIDCFSIQIIDTYDNDRELIDEMTLSGSPTLKYDSGDDLYGSLMSSELSFNMLATDFQDGVFLHLLTGDENRYKVRLFSSSEDPIKTLIWQGFLLPDQYSEPYKNGVLPVEFTAVDRLGSLKGKYLDSWYYANRFPIAELIAIILQQTGIDQGLIVKPSIVPYKNKWKNINVPLSHYDKDGKLTDIYTILADVLEAQALTLYSYRGYWWLEGFTRKGDESGVALQFDYAGNPGLNLNFVKNIYKHYYSQSPSLLAITPWKSVSVNFEQEGNKNIFSDNVVKKEIHLTNHVENSENINASGNAYRNGYFRDWTKVGCPELIYRDSEIRKKRESFNYKPLNFSLTGLSSLDVNYSLNNYFVCPERPFIKKNVEYQLQITASCKVIGTVPIDVLNTKLQEKKFDSLLRFQLFVNNVLILVNIPTLADTIKYEYDRSVNQEGDVKTLTFRIKTKFTLNQSGLVEFRALHPIIDALSFGVTIPIHWEWDKLQINVLDDEETDDIIRLDRPINYTLEKEVSPKFTCSQDESIENSFGLGFPTNSFPYTFDIPRNVSPQIFTDTQVFPTGNSVLTLQTFRVTQTILNDLFKNNLRKGLFTESVLGVKKSFNKIWGLVSFSITKGTRYRLGYLLNYTNEPLLPKKYNKIDSINPSDVLKAMVVKYNAENFDKRSQWILIANNYDYPGIELVDVQSYASVLGNAIISVQPEVLFRLEGVVKDLLFPDDLIRFRYNNEDKIFIPTSLTIDLSNAETSIVCTERKTQRLTDISYE